MIKIIPKGTHRAWSFPRLLFEKTITRTVTFFPSCKYEFEDSDQLDWNKLFGIAFFPGKHTSSYRFGWRYNKSTGKIELAAYYYINKVRYMRGFASVSIMKPIECRIQYQDGYVEFKISTGESFTAAGGWQPFGWKLGLFFGGNKPAPADLKIDLQ